MFNEGKEIVEYLEKNREQIQSSSYYPNDVLTCKDLIKLMNYIILLEAEVDSRTNFYKNTKKLYLDTSKKLHQLETNIDEAVEYLKYALDEEKETPSKHNDWRLDLLEILERGKE